MRLSTLLTDFAVYVNPELKTKVSNEGVELWKDDQPDSALYK